MRIRLNIEIEIVDEEKLRRVHKQLDERYRKRDSEINSPGSIVNELLLNLDKLPNSIKEECREDERLNCIGINFIDSWSKISRDLDTVEYD